MSKSKSKSESKSSRVRVCVRVSEHGMEGKDAGVEAKSE